MCSPALLTCFLVLKWAGPKYLPFPNGKNLGPTPVQAALYGFLQAREMCALVKNVTNVAATDVIETDTNADMDPKAGK